MIFIFKNFKLIRQIHLHLQPYRKRYYGVLTLSAFLFNLIFFWKLTTMQIPESKSAYKLILRTDDFSTIVNYRDFKYLISKPKCEFKFDSKWNKTLPYMLILVHSEPSSFERRGLIRDTWGHFDYRMKMYFLLGATTSSEIQQKVYKENSKHNDIIQGNFIDSYRNNTYKSVMGLKWFTYNCADAKFLVNMEDTVFINTPYVYEFMEREEKISPINHILGDYIPPLLKYKSGKYAVTDEEFKSRYFPSYARRYALIYSNDVAVRMYEKAQNMNFFWIDDIFISGLLRLQINGDIKNINSTILTWEKINNLKKTSVNLPPKFLFTATDISFDDYRLLWEKTEWDRLDII